MARLICRWVPSVEKVRMVNSGTEATMSCVRLARGATNRKLIVKFEGCYHGHVDSLLVKAGSGALTHGSPDSAGIPQEFADLTIAIPFNDPEMLPQPDEASAGRCSPGLGPGRGRPPTPAPAGQCLSACYPEQSARPHHRLEGEFRIGRGCRVCRLGKRGEKERGRGRHGGGEKTRPIHRSRSPDSPATAA